MNADSMLVLLLRTGVVLGVGLIAMMATAKLPALRLAIARVSLVVAVGLSLASPWLRERSHPVVPIRWQQASEPLAPTQPVVKAESSGPSQGSASSAVQATRPSEPFDWGRVVGVSWLVGTVLLLGHLCLGYRTLSRIRRECVPITDQELLDTLVEISRKTGIRQPQLIHGGAVDNPFVAGIRRPAIYLPKGWNEKVDVETARAVLQHEAAHIANGDLRWRLCHRLVSTILWPQALLWLLSKPMASASEEICDRHVLASGIPDVRYADCLLRLREQLHARPSPSLGIGALSSKSSLSRRIHAILDRRRSRDVRVSRPVTLLTRGGIALSALAGVIVFAVPQEAEIPDPYATWVKAPYAARVKLLDRAGRSIPTAQAWLQVSGDPPGPVSKELVVENGMVLLSGDAELPHCSGRLLVKAPGKAFGIASVWPAPSRITTMQLDEPASAAGRLLLPDGSPAAGVPVFASVIVGRGSTTERFQMASMSGPLTSLFETRAAADGTFLLSGLAPDTMVQLDVADDRFAHLGYSTRLKATHSKPTSRQDIRLRPTGEIGGRVFHAGRPEQGVRIVVQGNHVLDPTNTDSGEAITGPDGTYRVKRLAKGMYNVVVYPNDKPYRELTAAAREGVTVSEGMNTTGVDLELVPGAVVSGTVKDRSGKPVPDVYVAIYGPANPQSSGCVQAVFSDADGKYQLRVPAGKQYLYIGDSRFERQDRRLEVADGDTSVEDFVVRRVPARSADASQSLVATDVERQVRAPKPIPPFAGGGPFYGPAILPNGAKVRLAYLQDDAKAPHTIWHPDGSRATAAERAASLNMHGFTSSTGASRTIFANVVIDGVPRGSYDCEVQVPHRSERNVWQGYGDEANKTMDLASFHAPRSLKTTTMRFGIAAGPFRVYSRGRIGEAPLYAQVSDGRTQPPATLVGDESVSVQLRISEELEGKDIHAAAYTRDGRALELASWQTETSRDGPNKPWTRSFGFAGGGVKDVYRVELLVRDYEWVTFRGLHLYPNGE